jgi:ribose/xylose/arabinose/galactoside ABC-type transport system permease subunit
MVFEDSSQADTPGSRFVGEGFRLEPDFRDPAAPTVPVVPGQVAAQLAEQPAEATIVSKRGAPPNLAFVFDDPEDGEPGRDRMLIHGMWELLLALAVAGVGYLLYRSDSGAFTADGWRTLVLGATVLGLGAMAAALSLRAGAPNLAIGAVAVGAAVYFGQHAGSGFAAPLGVVIGLAAAVGAVQGLVVVGLQVPGWAAGLGTALAVIAWIGAPSVLKFSDGYNPTHQAYWWFGAVAAVSVIAGLVGIATPIRRAVGGFRPVADPAKRRPAGAAAMTLGATVVSSILAAVAGVLTIAVDRGAPTSFDVLPITAFAFGIALLGGTSAFGRRGGIFGTVLAALLVAVSLEYAAHTEPGWSMAAIAAVTVGLGLLVTRLVEWFGRPAPARADDSDEDWAPRVHAATTTTTTNGWAPVKPPTQTTLGSIWSGDDAWGTTPR